MKPPQSLSEDITSSDRDFPIRPSFLVLVLALVLIGGACGGGAEYDTVGAAVTIAELAEPASCSGSFISHDLDHVTRGAGRDTSMLDGTGAGVAVADLDGDGMLDIALANLSGSSSVFWNQGSFGFERQHLIDGRFREVSAVDQDGDGDTDIVMSTGVGVPVLMRNQGQRVFDNIPLEGVGGVAYSMAWGDLHGDGDVDLVTGSYNAELTADRDFASIREGRSGVILYESTPDGYETVALSSEAQALAVLLEDVNADGQTDIMVGNDLLTPDSTWVYDPESASAFRGGAFLWTPAEPFEQTTFSTMSLDAADYDNDGDVDFFATDMHPMSDDPTILQAWEPIMEDMDAQTRLSDDPQVMANVFQVAGDNFKNRASDLGVMATGWSWSGLFGDLDNDTLQDVYVVNGMTADSLFPDLPDFSLVEENQAFRNEAGMMVAAPEWELDSTAGGRGMVMADLDRDGDLDIVINNLNSKSQVFENQVCAGGGLTVDLQWEGAQNTAALGAVVTASVEGGPHMTRKIQISRGYLSSSPAQAHFGLGDAAEVALTVTWPDGAQSEIGDVPAGSHVTVTRSGTESS